MFENIDFKGGKITYNDFDIDFDKPFEGQVFSFKEDLFQVEYQNNYLIDIGWYHEFNPKGWFKICVIKDYDWVKPIYEKRCRLKKTLEKYLQQAVDIASQNTH